ncbi:MAG: hypothetical protein Q4E75_01910 [bacterium]|nr:hypothetical protein [bacterium]
MTSPKVVVMNKYTPSYNNLNFHYKTKEAVHNSTMNMFDYYADNKKKAFFMLDYFSGKIGKDKEMNIMFENGEYATKDQIEQRKRQYEKYIENSNIYKLVISFPEGFLEENVDIKTFEKKLAKEIIPQFLKKCGFVDIKKMSYQFSLHTNTKHLHFHLSFAEKQPNYKSYGKIDYRNKGKLTKEELRYFKDLIIHSINREKVYTPLLKETNKNIEELKKYFSPKDKNFLLNNKEDILLEEKILKLGELLNKYRDSNQKIKFNSIKDKEIIALTKDIKKYIFSKDNNEFKELHNEFKNNLNNINNYFKSIAESNHSDTVDTSLIKNKQKYLDNYILNAIVNHANYKYKNPKFTEDELLREVIHKEYKKNRSMSKYDIVRNILSNTSNCLKFKNKYQIRQAVRNINDELEEAQKDFDKLFQVDKEYS